jgi:ribose transport system ATP-binding protein
MRAAYGLPRGAKADVGILAEVKPASDAEAAS